MTRNDDKQRWRVKMTSKDDERCFTRRVKTMSKNDVLRLVNTPEKRLVNITNNSNEQSTFRMTNKDDEYRREKI